jgi:predicted TPR repeat methyltransferase
MINSKNFWESRYSNGGNSGSGSYGRLAEFKNKIINSYIDEFSINKIVEFGCGDGNQLRDMNTNSYVGFDVSTTAVDVCSELYKNDSSKDFYEYTDNLIALHGTDADISMSIDVIFHLVEDDVFDKYMRNLFAASDKLVLIYSSDYDSDYTGNHMRYRKFTKWVELNAPDWSLIKKVDNLYPYNKDVDNAGETSISDFYLFRKND